MMIIKSNVIPLKNSKCIPKYGNSVFKILVGIKEVILQYN